MNFFVRYIELILTAVGLALCGLAIVAIPSSESKWFDVAMVSITIGVVHGVIFFVVRKRERRARSMAIADAAHMLQDRVNNLMTAVLYWSQHGDEEKTPGPWRPPAKSPASSKPSPRIRSWNGNSAIT